MDSFLEAGSVWEARSLWETRSSPASLGGAEAPRSLFKEVATVWHTRPITGPNRLIGGPMSSQVSDKILRINHEIIGAAIQIHRVMGPGRLESAPNRGREALV